MRVAEQPTTGSGKGFQGYEHSAGRFFPDTVIASCGTFRDACALAWENRANPSLTFQMLAVMAGLQNQHVGEYFQREPFNAKGNPRRPLPAEKLHAVEAVLGNRILSQYLMHRGELTIFEAVVAARGA